MPNKRTTGSLRGIVDKMNKTYNSLIGNGFTPGVNRRILPVLVDGEVSGWKMQRYENDEWVDLDDTQFETMKDLIEYYKGKD